MWKKNMWCLVILLCTKFAFAQTYTWVGTLSDDYQVAGNWSPVRSTPTINDVLVFNALSPILVRNVANQAIGAIQIATGTATVSLASDVSTNVLKLSANTPLIFSTPGKVLAADYLTIQLNNTNSFNFSAGVLGIAPSTGGKIVINGPMVLAGGTLDVDVVGTGGTTINELGSITNSSGNFVCNTAASITWAFNSNYYHARNGAFNVAIPDGSWQPGSTCTVTGMDAGTVAPTGFERNVFDNFSWNCSLQSGDVTLLPSGTPLNVNGTFCVIATGAKELQLTNGKATIKTNKYVQNAGKVTLQAGTDTTNFIVLDSFTHYSGTLNGVGGSGAGMAIMDFKGRVNKVAGSIWASTSTSPAAQLLVQFSAKNSQAVIIAGAWNAPAAGRCNIANLNADFLNGISLTGYLRVYNTNSTNPATFTMNSVITGATAGVSYTGGGSGGNTLIYSGNFFQFATTTEFPASNGPLNLTINNSLGVNFGANISSRSLAGTLSMLNGNLSLGADTLSLINAIYSNQLNYVGGFVTTGTLARYIAVSGLPINEAAGIRFPFGAGINDRSIRLFFSASTLSAGTAGMVYVTHTPKVGVSSLLPNVLDNGINLDKKTLTQWTITTSPIGGFNVGSGGETISLSAAAFNIGSVDNYLNLRLTDGVSAYGLLPYLNMGTNATPVTVKSGLTMSDINKPIYIGSDNSNPLIIITFTWTGASGIDGDWTRAGNWTGGVGYPSASTEAAVILSPSAPFQPFIKTGSNISVYSLTVGTGTVLTMQTAAGIAVYDTVSFIGTASFAPTSTFGYASSFSAQNILDLPYGGLALSGTATKTLAPIISVTGTYTLSGNPPDCGTGNFIYAGAGAQRVAAGKYYNLTLKNNRAGQIISLGNSSAPNTIDVKNIFDVNALSNFTVNAVSNTFNFSNAGTQFIPGFYYYLITNEIAPGNLAPNRTLDPLGAGSVDHVITCLNIDCPASFVVANSKVKYYVSGTRDAIYFGGTYHDLEISGNLNGKVFDFGNSARISIAGNFVLSLTNFIQGTQNLYVLNFNGTGNQTIPAFKTNTSNNTPAFKYSEIRIAGGNRNVSFMGTGSDTVYIRGLLRPEFNGINFTASPFGANNGFIVDRSSIDFSVSSNLIPVLKPAVAGGNNYNHLSVSGGTKTLSGNMTIGGNLAVTGTSTNEATLLIGNGNTERLVNVLGNLSIKGSGTGAVSTAQVDMNTGTLGSATLNLLGNLSISGFGQLMGTTSAGNGNGLVIFKGSSPQIYTNTAATLNNGQVNFIVGDGITSSTLLLASPLKLLSSITAANRGTLTVAPNAALDCNIYNVSVNGGGNAIFKLDTAATLIIANTGGIEGAANNGTDGSISNSASLLKTYHPSASYVFNASTSSPFPSAITQMANLTLSAGAAVALNQSVAATNTFRLSASSVFALGNNHFNLKSTALATAQIAPVPDNANITYGTGRFVVERFYPARRAWRLVTAPIQADASTSFFNSWQMGGAQTVGSGTFITGKNASTINGLDISPMNHSSLRLYNGTAFTDLTNTKNLLLSGTAGIAGKSDNFGMLIFIRGDRSNANLFNLANVTNTTLRDTGRVQIKTQQFSLNAPANGYDLVGNPYAAAVDISTVMSTATNINTATFWTYDPFLNLEQGGYIALTSSGSNWVATPPSPSGQGRYLQSSQAFFVQKNSAASGLITFREADKSLPSASSNFRLSAVTKEEKWIQKPTQGLRFAAADASFRTNLYLQESQGTLVLADGNLALLNENYSNQVNIEDAVKFPNPKETFSLVRDGIALAVEKRQPLNMEDTLFYRLTNSSQRNYQLQFEPFNMNVAFRAYLEDNFTKMKTPVSLTDTSTFSFSINSDLASTASDRFKIVFEPTPPLAADELTIKAMRQQTGIVVKWSVENEASTASYALEKSSDGSHFEQLASYRAPIGGGNKEYQYLDKDALVGANYYRIKRVYQSGEHQYSKVVAVNLNYRNEHEGISIYPNPTQGNRIALQLHQMPSGIYQMHLINALGQKLIKSPLRYAGSNEEMIINLKKKMSKGMYELFITAPDQKEYVLKLLVQ